MRRSKLVMPSLLLCCALAGGLVWMASKEDAHAGMRNDPTMASQASPTLPEINEKARAAKSGSEADIRALADATFSLNNFDQAPAGLDEAVKERLVRAEINYRAGNGRGVSDANIVRMVNGLARTLNAPAYARTNVFEVRRLKAGLLPYTSDLQARRVGAPAGQRPDAAAATMSPLEATFFAVALVQQKRFNAEYQLTNEEWVALHGGKRKSKANEKFRDALKAKRNDTSRTDEMQQAVERGFSSMSPMQILSLPERLLDTLGVER